MLFYYSFPLQQVCNGAVKGTDAGGLDKNNVKSGVAPVV